MKIEITNGVETPVTKFFSASTPETDALISVGLENADRECVSAEFARKLERERDEAIQKYDNLVVENMLEVNKICNQRGEAEDALMKIEEIFLNGNDAHEDWKSMGQIARTFLEKNI